jgi:hypothetical protein
LPSRSAERTVPTTRSSRQNQATDTAKRASCPALGMASSSRCPASGKLFEGLPLLLSIPQLAKILGISRATGYGWPNPAYYPPAGSPDGSRSALVISADSAPRERFNLST